MTNQLIPVFNGTISNEPTLLCNARELHTFLSVGKRFASWIAERIEQYGFVHNQDYIAISQNREIGHGRGKIDYHLTLDTAKELALYSLIGAEHTSTSGYRARQTCGFFTSIDCYGRVASRTYNTRKGKTTGCLVAVFKYLATHLNSGF